ncbi:MAG: ribosome-associated translation inhibitor RaiA [bacterium]
MKTSITARHFDMSDNTREYTLEAMNGLAKYFDRISDAQAVFTREKDGWHAELIVGVPGRTLTSEGRADLLFTAIDEASGKLGRQLKRYKGKLSHEKSRREVQATTTAPIEET